MVALGSPALAAAAQAPAAPTFTKDVAPIFQAKCEACHRTDSMAPMSLKTFAEVRPWVRSIRSRVAERQMPPWQIARSVGIQKFKNDRSLTDAERETVLKWIDSGAPQGDPKDMPPAVSWPEDQGWNFAAQFGQKEPDLDPQVRVLHDAGDGPGRLGSSRHGVRPDRAALGARH